MSFSFGAAQSFSPYTHIPQAEQVLQAAQIGYQTGTLDFLSLIDSVRAIEQIHLEHE